MKTEAVIVMFRVDREGHVFAIFPCEPESPGHVTTWEINGGTSAGPRVDLIASSRPAKPREYRETARLLRNHHPIRIVKRTPVQRRARGS